MNVLKRYLVAGAAASALALAIAPTAMAATGPSCIIGNNPPPAPTGWKFVTFYPNGTFNARTGPVLKWNGDCYWTYSSAYNGCNFDIVEYRQGTDRVLGSWPEQGDRYIGRIKVNDTEQTVTFCGQSAFCTGSGGVTVPFAELNIDSNAGSMPEVPYAGFMPVVLAVGVGAVWWVRRGKVGAAHDRQR